MPRIAELRRAFTEALCTSWRSSMTATSEFSLALRHSWAHIWRLDGISTGNKLVLSFLKVWAIGGYHAGRRWSRRHPVVAAPETRADVRVEKAAEVDAGWGPALQALTRVAGRLVPELKLGDSKGGKGPPRVAVVIPCLLESRAALASLRTSVQALLSNTLRPALVCIVDDCSPTLHIADDEELTAPPEVMVLRVEPNTGPARARNAGLEACQKHNVQVVCFTDADCLSSPTWLAEMVAAQARQPGIVCGRMLATKPRSFIGMYHDVFGTLNGRRCRDGSLLYGCTCNLSIDAATVPLSFHPSFPQAAFEDVEFCVRARKQNIALSYNETAVVRHAFEEGPRGLYSQFRRYGCFERHMCTLHPEYLSWLWSSVDIPSRLDFSV